MPDATKVLVVDDEEAVREVLRMRLERWGYRVLLAANAAEARQAVEEEAPDLVVSDLVLPDATGIELLEAYGAGEGRPVILITAHGSVDKAVEAMKLGARDFLTKPLDHDQLKAVLEEASRQLGRRQAAKELEGTLEEGARLGGLIGSSKPMRKVFAELEVLAVSEASAILTGESGTGKEVAAQTLHQLSARARGPFVALNAAAIPETLVESELFGHEKGAFTGAGESRKGCFELADGGTLFLDEIAEMPVALQPKLLRVLESRRLRRVGGNREIEVDVRVLAATNQPPVKAVEEGRLREDLFYRLNVFTVELPPLRKHLDDLPLLAQHFIGQANRKHSLEVEGLSDAAMAKARGYHWPGNVRELRNVIERAVILARSGWIEVTHLPPFLGRPEPDDEERIVLPADVTASEAEKILILETLKRTGNNKSQTARVLGLDVKTIRNKLRSWGMMSDD
jgi:DNA-binding NtrC family response regulator